MKQFAIIVVAIFSIYGIEMQAQSMKTFTYHGQGVFSISYPSNWEVRENPQEKVRVLILAPIQSGSNFRTNLNVISSINSSESLERLFQIQQNVYNSNKQIFNDYKLERKEDVVINNIHGIKITASYGLQGVKVRGIQYILKKADNTQYTITFTIGLSSYERDIKIVENIIQSFKSL